MQTMVSSHVWQRRTHKIIAMAVIIIGLTMMISTIPQCIYIGLIFIMIALGWLAWMRMKEKKSEPPRPSHQPHASVSPVLFLVASQNFTQRPGSPTPVDPNDKPPSYDQIIKLDGLPPDYFTILSAKPPRYEDIEGMEKAWHVTIPIDIETSVASLPTVHSYRQINASCNSPTGSCSGIDHYSLTPLTLEVPTLGRTSSIDFSPSSESVSPDEETKQNQIHTHSPADESTKSADEGLCGNYK